MIHRRGKALIVLLFLVFFLNGCDLLNISPEEKNMAPEITGDSYVVFNVGDDVPDWKDFIQATDEEDGIIRITDSMIEDNDIDLKNGGLFEVDVYVSDSDGKTSLFTINVEVIDNIAPVITLIGDEIIHINKGDFYFDLGVSVVENSAYYDIDVSQVVDVNTPGETKTLLEFAII